MLFASFTLTAPTQTKFVALVIDSNLFHAFEMSVPGCFAPPDQISSEQLWTMIGRAVPDKAGPSA